MTTLKICGTGSYLPENIVTNAMMEKIVDTTDEWIKTRTGIEQRHFVDGDSGLSMSHFASLSAIKDAAIEKDKISAIICASITHEYSTPSLACMLHRELELPENCMAFDINAACSGFVYALNTAAALLSAGALGGKYVLVVGCEVLSRVTDFTDRGTCVLFGDGAGAAIVTADTTRPFHFICGTQGSTEALCIPISAAGKHPFTNHEPENKPFFINMNGQDVFRFAVESVSFGIKNVMEKSGYTDDDIRWYVCHQANERIIRSAAKRLGAPIEKFFMNIAKRGNTSAASIPIALDEMRRVGILSRGDKIVLAGFGGGLTYGCASVKF